MATTKHAGPSQQIRASYDPQVVVLHTKAPRLKPNRRGHLDAVSIQQFVPDRALKGDLSARLPVGSAVLCS